jgi:hypothetical protein
MLEASAKEILELARGSYEQGYEQGYADAIADVVAWLKARAFEEKDCEAGDAYEWAFEAVKSGSAKGARHG